MADKTLKQKVEEYLKDFNDRTERGTRVSASDAREHSLILELLAEVDEKAHKELTSKPAIEKGELQPLGQHLAGKAEKADYPESA